MIADNTKMPKIEYYEILPKNKNTEKLEKKRKEEEEAKKAREDAVSKALPVQVPPARAAP